MAGPSPLLPLTLDTWGYRLLQRLGSGGQGVVYLGADRSGVRVAVKVLRSDVADSPRGRELFVREAELAQRVARFCTAQVLAAGLHDSQPYVVSEYVPGPSLDHAVTEAGLLSGSALERLAVGTAAALAAIHEAGVVHRDFKPANVLLGQDGPRVIDFGIARTAGATTLSGSLIGTPGYMAPEQLRSEEAGPAADVFAWACVMTFAGAGRPPFGTRPLHAVMDSVLHGEPDLGGIDGQVAELVRVSLTKEAGSRPSAEQILLNLLGRGQPPQPQASTSQKGILAEGASVAAAGAIAPRFTRARRRRLQLIAGAVLAVLLAVGGTYVITNIINGGNGKPENTTQRAGRHPIPGELPGIGELVRDPGGVVTLTSYSVSSRHDAKAYVLDPETGRFKATPYTKAVLSPDGLKLAAFDGSTLVIADRRTGRERRTNLPAHVTGLHWSPDGTRLVTTAWHRGLDESVVKGFVTIDVSTLKVTFREAPIITDPLDSILGADVTWDKNGVDVIAISAGKLATYSPDTGEEISNAASLPGAAVSAHYSPDGTMLATPCRPAPEKFWDATCLWDMTSKDDVITGQPRRIRMLRNLQFIAWYDTNQIIADQRVKDGYETYIVGLTGRQPQLFVRTKKGSTLGDLQFTPIPR